MKKHLLLIAAAFLLSPSSPAATQTDIPGPPGSGAFGTTVTVLPNGNFVVTDPSFDQLTPPVADVGAVYLYNPDGLLISTLLGSNANDRVGLNGTTILANGHFVVSSTAWNGNRGAVTWGDAHSGFLGGARVTVSAANSLIGSTASDSVGGIGITKLTNGNYVVRSPQWDNTATIPIATNAGAATWGNGFTGTIGPVTAANSLVGTSANDSVGSSGVTPLANGNYVVSTPNWDKDGIVDVGAATWGNGTTGIKGPVSPDNSLIGSTKDDWVSINGITALTNGNYVISSPFWDRSFSAKNAGAVTWGNGPTGITNGPVSSSNSLIGASTDHEVGSGGVTALTNGNYVVLSPNWDNVATNAGAVTWGNGTTGIKGFIWTNNSLIGSSSSDNAGGGGVTALTNGNYVVSSPNWDNGSTVDVGAATWGNGSTGISGPISATNSLVGTSINASVGSGGVAALTNGNYVVSSPNLQIVPFFTQKIGAATWGNGARGIKGPVTAANSLIGSRGNDNVSEGGITALANGNYVVLSPNWDNTTTFPDTINAGAATWGNGFTGISGSISAVNSLVGTSADDAVGSSGVTALTNGNYLVISPNWDNPAPAATNAGAVTWGNGATGIRGIVTSDNSLIGTYNDDSVGEGGVSALPNSNYIVLSPNWQIVPSGPNKVGAATLGNGSTGIFGSITAANSLIGTSDTDNIGMVPPAVQSDGQCILPSPNWDNASFGDSGAVTMFDGQNGTTGTIRSANSVLGTVASGGGLFAAGYDPARKQMIVGRLSSNIVTLFRGDRLRSLARPRTAAPGSAQIDFGTSGTAAVNPRGAALFDSSLTGSGSSTGRSRAIFAFSPTFGTDLVLQSGTPLSALGVGLPSNATAPVLLGQTFNQPNLGLFQATIKGSGITSANNRLLIVDNGASVRVVYRTGTPVPLLENAALGDFAEVLQSHDHDLITIPYKLKSGGAVTSANDEGLLFLNHGGTATSLISTREGQPAFSGGGSFGSFIGRPASGLGNTIYFTAFFKPTGATPIPAVFSTTQDGFNNTRLAKSGDFAPNSGGGTYSTFTAITQDSGNALVRATLKSTSANEGLYQLPANNLLIRKGAVLGDDLYLSRILRFWPSGPDQLILQVQLTGVGVKTSNNQALILRQSDGTYLTLLRTGNPAPGTGPAPLRTISAVDVNPVSGLYAVLGTLSSSPSSSNQALWTGNPTLGNDTTQQILRLPQLTLRKGNPYSTESTPNSIIRSIALKPAIDPTGAGGRGLAQALGANGDLALFITTDRNLTELVLLDR